MECNTTWPGYTYLGVFEPAKDGAFGVYFPDLPGCTSYGKSLDEAQQNAQEALGLHIYGMEKDGDDIPRPSSYPEIDPETDPGFLVCPITIFPDLVRDEMDNRRVKTNVTIPLGTRTCPRERNELFKVAGGRNSGRRRNPNER